MYFDGLHGRSVACVRFAMLACIASLKFKHSCQLKTGAHGEGADVSFNTHSLPSMTDNIYGRLKMINRMQKCDEELKKRYH
jgi:hypothetical protein